MFTTDLASTPVHVAKWSFLGESWPFFRPNFVNMEQYRSDMGVDEVQILTYETSRGCSSCTADHYIKALPADVVLVVDPKL